MRNAGTGAIRRLVIPVKYIGVEVSAVLPCNGADLRIDPHLPEGTVIGGDSLERGSPQVAGQVNLALRTIGEPQSHYAISDNFNRGDVNHFGLLREVAQCYLAPRVEPLGRPVNLSSGGCAN